MATNMMRLIIALLVVGAFAQDRAPLKLRTHSFEVPYLDSTMRSRWLEFGGSTVIRADQYIRLTHDRQSQQGWITSRVPITAQEWEVEFEYKISGKGHLNGDGFALWLTKSKISEGPVFGAPDKFEGLGIFFDTYKNNRPGTVFPYVMAMVGDGNTAYSAHNDGKDNEIGGCTANGIRNAAVPTKARLRYLQQTLTLALQYKGREEWTSCFDVPNVKLPGVVYLGFSAETGELTDNHDIINITTSNLYNSRVTNSGGSSGSSRSGSQNKYSSTTSPSSEGGSWTWFFLKLILFAVACGGGYVGYTVWRTSKRRTF